MRVSIIGTGQIGKDLLHKLSKLKFCKIVSFVGRRQIMKEEICNIDLSNDIILSDKSINFFIDNPKCCDVVFDCTDAFSAAINHDVFKEQNIMVIDLTPSNLGKMYVPNITLFEKKHLNLNMITCGAQSCLPILFYMKNNLNSIEYVETVTQISSESAGMATRINIDKYIETTQNAITKIIGINNNKVILNLNPSKSTIMKTTIYIVTKSESDFCDFNDFVKTINNYIPNYIVSEPIKKSENVLMVHINVIGSGDYISQNYGNLDIINCAAVHALRQIYTYFYKL
jgi:acetaldehyde dehydrogenase